MQRVVSSYIDTASIITLTEVDSEKREKVLRQFPGWGVTVGDKTGRDDCAVMWNKSEWTVLFATTYRVAKYMAGNIGAALAVLEHQSTGQVILVSTVHLPSAVEGNGRVSGGRADEWYTARKNWVRTVKRVGKRYGVKKFLLVADWNLDLKKRWVRVLIKSQFPTWKWAWKKFPKVGTHGNRLIDFSLIKGLKVVRTPVIHKITGASDHRGYHEVLGW